MNRSLKLAALGALLGISALVSAAPYEDYKIQIQRTQEAKRTAALGAAPQNSDHSAMTQEHMQMMQEMNKQLQEARSVDQMTSEQMRAWISKHAQLMERMHQQMKQDGRAPQGCCGMGHEGKN